jgi:hypothetical protein
VAALIAEQLATGPMARSHTGLGFLNFFTFLSLDSEQKAKDGVLYRYKHAANRFSVKVTPQQVDELKSEPPFHVFSCEVIVLHHPIEFG